MRNLDFLFKKSRLRLLMASCLFLIQCFWVTSQASVAGAEGKQQMTVTGTVKDAKDGTPVVGATISVQGGKNGTISDLDGKYTISVPSGDAVLIFSFIGYNKETVKVAGRSIIDVNIVASSQDLTEVVVVGYGTQTKAGITGSVTQVKGDDVLKGRATTSIATALQGEIPGLTITRTSSRPGNEGTSISLRGGISVNTDNAGPMILIDGTEAYAWELSQINPNDIESVSTLKDAAASIYGTRANGGVILVTTKRGKEGKIKIAYSGSAHMNYLGKRFPVASGSEWAKMNIEANTNDAVATGVSNNYWLFSESQYKKIANGEKFVEAIGNGNLTHIDPSANQFNAVYGTTWGQDQNLSISGGTDKLKVMSSIGYAKDHSLIKVAFDGTEKYNFRTNVDYNFNKWVKTEANVSYDKRTVTTPTQGVGQGIQDMYIFPLYNEKGQFYDVFGSNNILAKLIEGGQTVVKENLFRLSGKLSLDMGFVDFLKGLSFSVNANVRERIGQKNIRNSTITLYDWDGELGKVNNIFSQSTPANLSEQDYYYNTFYYTTGAFANYTKKIQKHNFTFMIGTTAEETKYSDLMAKRTGLQIDNLNAINTGDGSTATNSGDAYSTALLSYIGRANYSFNDRYLLEGVFRRDGSSKLAPENRWSNFIGGMAAVRFEEFDFIKRLNIFDQLKAKISYGETGGLSGIGNYDYIASMSTSATTVFGTTPSLTSVSYISAMTSRSRNWERVATTNYGLDFSLLKTRLSGSFDYYHRKNIGMLINVAYPSVIGATAPYTNDGNFTSKGFELSLNWKDKIGKDITYRVGFSLADARTEVTSYAGKTTYTAGLNSTVVGRPYNSIFVYRTKGYLQTDAEVSEYYSAINGAGSIVPVQSSVNRLTPGCVRRVDKDNDGAITTADLDYYGDALPHYTYGINLGASYKGFDLGVFFQGVGQQYVVRTGALAYPFAVGYQNQNATFLGKTWSPTNTDAEFPVMSRNSARNTWNYVVNDINVQNVSYIRCKSVSLGYTMPQQISMKAGFDKARLWVSGDNLFEFSNVKDGFDPESQAASGQGNMDVFARTLSFGIDLNF